MKWNERVDLMADITQEDIDIYENGKDHSLHKEVDIASIYDSDISDFIITHQTNTMIIIFKEAISFDYTVIKTITSAIKVYLFNRQNIRKVHIIISTKIPYDVLLNFLIIIIPLLGKYIKKKIVIHHYNIYKNISKRAPSILNALPLYLKKRIIVDGSEVITIENMRFIYKIIDGIHVLTMRRI